MRGTLLPLALLLCVATATGLDAQDAPSLNVLFLGDDGHHRPADRFRQIQPVLAARGIETTYTDDVGALSPETLGAYDALIVYANTTRISPEQESALVEYVESGKGFVPIHCASYCFLNSPRYIALVGAQFRRHGTGVFRTTIVERDHPVMRGLEGFESWDETYVHTKHNEEGRTVLSYREEGSEREPWTWVRSQGGGRVFYTAWGHDQRTWGNPGFQDLLERGIRWAAGSDASVPTSGNAPFPVPEMTEPRTDVQPFEYVDVGKKIPNYTPSRQWGTQGEPLNMMQKPLPAAESLKHFVVPRGFHVELFASEPDLGGKAICMTWDERGRLWVGETFDYPNELQPENQGRDRVRICEDTDGDWKADKFTVFAEKISLPSSIAFYKGGAIVQDGTRTLYMKDTDGDDVADTREVMFTGWNQRDTHGGVSNFQYGLDNWIWAMQGYNPSSPTVRGERSQRFSNGFFRFRPDGSALEFIRSTNNNTWGLGIAEDGVIFGSTANRNPSVYMPIPNRYYEGVRGWTPSLVLGTIADTYLFKPITDKVRQVDQHGGYTAGAGHALYTARTYPQEYWNRVAFVNGPTGHLTGAFVIDRDGADFRSSNKFNLLASDDEWSAPIMAEVGPDGNVWVIDWYNFIVQHNPTPQGFRTGRGAAYETDLRDKKHARIYRVVYDAAPPAERISLAGASPEKLVAMLKSDVMLWRKHAQRLLVERGKKDVVPALVELARDTSVDAVGLNTAAMHALWTLHGLGALDGSDAAATDAARGALAHPSAGVRRNATQTLVNAETSTAAVLSNKLLEDRDAQVRLAALLALADLPPTDEAGAAIARFASNPSNLADRWLRDATVAAAATNSSGFLAAVARLDASSEALEELLEIVAEHHGRGGPVESIGALLGALVESPPAIAAPIVDGLSRGWPVDSKPDLEHVETQLERLVMHVEAGSRGQLLRLARLWGSERLTRYAEELVSTLLDEVEDEERTDGARVASARRLIEFRRAESGAIEDLLDRISPRLTPELASGLVDVLRQSESEQLGELIVERLSSFSPTVRATAISVLLSRTAATVALLEAIDEGDMKLAELSLDQREALSRHPDGRVRRRARRILERAGAQLDSDRQKVLETLLPLAEETGDPAKGKLAFEKVCAKCHRHGGEGADVGPDLTGMSVHPKEELLTNIIDPNRSVEGNFRVYVVVTKDGRILNGMLASEARTAVELFDAEGKKHSILRDDIVSLVTSGNSLMPEGVEQELSREEIRDLLEFLTQRGRYTPLDLRKAATVASDRGMFTNEGADVERLIFDDWSPKTFQGVPFHVANPAAGTVKNVILLHGPIGEVSRRMPRSVNLTFDGKARAVHLLSGVSGWGFPYDRDQTVSLIVRFHYADGTQEDHELVNGVHFADYIRRVDVPKSEFAFALRSQQIRYLVVLPKKAEPLRSIELVKGPDETAPVVLAITVEAGE